MVFGNTEEKWIVVLDVAGLVFGIKVIAAPLEGWFQIGSAVLLLGIGQALVCFILFKLMACLPK
jgi:ABC-type nickel/cobalt efflux system permease component RcnA